MVSLRRVTIEVYTPADSHLRDIAHQALEVATRIPEAIINIDIGHTEEWREEDYVKAAIKEKKRLAP